MELDSARSRHAWKRGWCSRKSSGCPDRRPDQCLFLPTSVRRRTVRITPVKPPGALQPGANSNGEHAASSTPQVFSGARLLLAMIVSGVADSDYGDSVKVCEKNDFSQNGAR